MNTLLTASGTALARAIRAGDVSSRDVVEAHISRIVEVNPHLNAMVANRFEAARDEARAADERLQKEGPDAVPPFHGVPCTIKESIALHGMPHTAGIVARRHKKAMADAPTVARLRRAGIIPLGVTNTSEACMWMESKNHVYGRSNNPYDVRCTVGGSSGGEGAIVGAAGSPFGLGADVGGSIRMPAFFNGVFGHKPTGGLVPNTGQVPTPEGKVRRYCTTGPIARSAEDLYPLLRILAGADGVDGECNAPMPSSPDTVDVSTLRVVVVPGDGQFRVAASLLDAQARAAAALAARGAEVVMLPVLPGLRRGLEIWAAFMAHEQSTPFRTILGDGVPIQRRRALWRMVSGSGEHTVPGLGLAVLESLTHLIPQQYERALAHFSVLHDAVQRTLGDNGVLLYPPHPQTAPRHGRSLLPPVRWIYTGIWNVLEMPVTQVPLGLDDQGLPLGVQVAALPGQDARTLAVALALEKDCGGWVPPTTRFAATHE